MPSPEHSLYDKMAEAKRICQYDFQGAEHDLQEALQRGSQYAALALDGVGAIGRYFTKKASDEGWSEDVKCERTFAAVKFSNLAAIFMRSGLYRCIVYNPAVDDKLDVVRAEYVDGVIGAAYRKDGMRAATIVIDALGFT